MRLVPLASGSRGNATLVELGRQQLLIDAGVSATALAKRLEEAGVDPHRIDAIVLSHEHEDHSRGAARFSRKYGVPVICSVQTLEAMDGSPKHFAAWHALGGGICDLGGAEVESFPVPHDAAAPVGFLLRGEGLRLGIATDLGHATTLVVERLRGCHVLMIEANHDDRMLRDGPYPRSLKQRVAGRFGHLSNREAASLLGETVDGECCAVVLAHLSEKNNRPALAREQAQRVLRSAAGGSADLRIAQADHPSAEVRL